MSILSEEETQTARSASSMDMLKAGDILTYTKEEMIVLRESVLSRKRPDNLSTQFDSDDGLFSPLKWLEYRWECEGVKNRPVARKNELLKEENESTVLSPQRRAFSSGCRAPEDKNNEDEGEQQKRNWRSSANGAQKADFKPPYKAERERRGNASQSWRSNDVRSDPKLNSKGFGYNGRNGNRRDDERGEKTERLPEWADGPTTINDMIELKGFDEPKKREKKQRKNGEGVISPEDAPRPSSTSQNLSGAPSDSSQPAKSQSVTIPSSDEEFAKILGLLDNNDNSSSDVAFSNDFLSDILNSSVKEEPQAVTGSRLSRFFKSRADDGDNNPAGSQHRLAMVGQPVSEYEEGMASDLTGTAPPPHLPSASTSSPFLDYRNDKSLLSKIFQQTSTSSIPVNSSSLNGGAAGDAVPAVKNPVTLEDLERNLIPQQHADFLKTHQQAVLKGNPLQDPQEQAALLSKLNRVAREQREEGGTGMSASSSSPPAPPPMHPLLMQQQAAVAAAAHLNPAQMAHVVAQAQYNAAMAQAAAAFNGPVPLNIQEQIRQAAVKNMIQAQAMLQAKMAAAAAATGGGVGLAPNLIPSVLAAQMKQRPVNSAAAFIPASVQKHMAKTAAAPGSSSEKAEKSTSAAELEKVEMMTRAARQQQYAAMMSAMQAGLPMSNWRPPTQTLEGEAARPSSVLQQQQMAALALAHQQATLRKQQMAKLLLLQGQQHGGESVGVPSRMAAAPAVATSQPSTVSDELPARQTMQNPLEKLLAAAGARQLHPMRERENMQQPPSDHSHSFHNHPLPLPPTARPIPLEELERRLTESK